MSRRGVLLVAVVLVAVVAGTTPGQALTRGGQASPRTLAAASPVPVVSAAPASAPAPEPVSA
ncbi:MAG TPA: hypothetical protein VFD41_11265, partial [Actinomycetales bacterium]|nr:hypothetical protein [Actinomycetales bacterium]